MKRKLLTLLTALLLAAPVLSLAQNVVYVNTDAPGVHKEYDSKHGGYVWKNGTGDYLCTDKEMKSIWEMDKHVYFNGANGDPDNPKAASHEIKKVWDKNRGCYVWKNVYTGDFLGTDKKSVEEQEQKKAKELADKKQKELEKKQKEQEKKQKEQEKKQKDQQKQQQKKNSYDQDIQKAGKMVITTDEQMRQAEAALREVKAELASAQAEGIDLSGYGIEGYIKEIEDAINEYKRARNKMK